MTSMRVVTFDPFLWVVRADWLGTDRIVFGPAPLASCIAYITEVPA